MWNLRQVVLQVRDIVADEIFESHRLVSRYSLPRNLIEIMVSALPTGDVGRNVLDNVCDVVIETAPQGDQIGPLCAGILLHSHPRFLIVSWKEKIIGKLRAN